MTPSPSDRFGRKGITILLLTLFIFLALYRFLAVQVNVLSWDVFGYYLYLPASFIYNDLFLQDQGWINVIFRDYDPSLSFYQANELENGKWVIQYWIGTALFYSPFFFIADLLAATLGFPADGFSLPYQKILLIGGLIYAFAGLIYLVRILRIYFDAKTTVITVVLIFFGTNYFQLTAFEGTLLPHNITFMLFAALIFYTIRWHEQQKFKYALIIGAVIGLVFLVRATDAVCAIIPAIWGVFNRDSLMAKISLIKENAGQLIIAAAIPVIIFIPQVLYWKAATGELFFDSYFNSADQLDLLSPHISEFLFSFRKGWFVYTPLMLFTFAGFIQLYRKQRKIFWPFFIFIIIDIYVIASWSNWWYAGGSYSARAIVPAYTVMAFPLAILAGSVMQGKRLQKVIASAIGGLLITLNLFQTWQFEKHIINRERMTFEYYMAIFGRTSIPATAEDLLIVERSGSGEDVLINEDDYYRRLLFSESFDSESNTDSLLNGMLKLHPGSQFSPGPSVSYSELTIGDHAWIRTVVKIRMPKADEWNSVSIVAVFDHDDENYKYRVKNPDPENGPIQTIQMDYLTPRVKSEDDVLKVYVWYSGPGEIYLDELTVFVYDKR